MQIFALELKWTEEGVDGAGAIVVDGFRGPWRFVVGHQLAVVVEIGNDPPPIVEQGFPQSGFDPFGALVRSERFQPGLGFGDEGFGFGEAFGLCFGVEFFFASADSPGAGSADRS